MPGSRKIEVALVVPDLLYSGGVSSVAQFLHSVIRNSGDFDAKIVSLATSSKDTESIRLLEPRSWFRGVSHQAVEWNSIPCTHVGSVLAEVEFLRYRPRKQLSDLLQSSDVVQVVSGSPAWANAVIGIGKPVSLQVATRAKWERRNRDAGPKDIVGHWRKLMTAVTNKIDDRALMAVDAIQVENSLMLEYAQAVNKGRDIDIRFAPPGVDSTVFLPLADRKPRKDGYILCVGRLSDPRKNIGLLLNAYERLVKRDGLDVQLVLAGKTSPPREFWAEAEELDLKERVIFIHSPKQDELIRLYQRSLVFALPSDEEGLGIVLLEAMACGVPIVSTKSGGPETLIEHGVDGYLVERDDVEDMSDRLTRLINDCDLNLAMGASGRKKIEKRYDHAVAARAYIQSWRKLIDR